MNYTEAAKYQDAFDAFEQGTATLKEAQEVVGVIMQIEAYNRVWGVAAQKIIKAASQNASLPEFEGLSEEKRAQIAAILSDRDEKPRIYYDETAGEVVTSKG